MILYGTKTKNNNGLRQISKNFFIVTNDCLKQVGIPIGSWTMCLEVSLLHIL